MKKRSRGGISPGAKRKIMKVLLYAALAMFCLPFVLLFAIKSGAIGKLPSEEQLQTIDNFEASEVFSADGAMIGRYYIQNRTELEYSDLSPSLVDALVATEDARFFEHHGIDYRSLMRVFFKTILMGDRSAGGGSTITQQLAKNIYHRQEYAFFSMAIVKFREMLIASELEDIYSK